MNFGKILTPLAISTLTLGCLPITMTSCSNHDSKIDYSKLELTIEPLEEDCQFFCFNPGSIEDDDDEYEMNLQFQLSDDTWKTYHIDDSDDEDQYSDQKVTIPLGKTMKLRGDNPKGFNKNGEYF